MLRDRLRARLTQMGEAPDYVRLVEDVLGIRNTTPALARRLVSLGLVMEDQREAWTRVGQRVCAAAPQAPGVYVLRCGQDPLYVGKAVNLRRRFRAHFAQTRWGSMPVDLTRVTDAEWREVGSELEALMREAEWISTLRPPVNTQVGPPSTAHRAIPRRILCDQTVILPSIAAESVELIAARVTGETMIQQTRRDGSDLPAHVDRIWTFFHRPDVCHHALAPIVFSWLAQRGAAATRIENAELTAPRELGFKLATALASPQLFSERLIFPEVVSRSSLGPR